MICSSSNHRKIQHEGNWDEDQDYLIWNGTKAQLSPSGKSLTAVQFSLDLLSYFLYDG